MQKRTRCFSILAAAMLLSWLAGAASAAQTLEFKDGTVIKGEIQNKILLVQTSFGILKPEVDKIAFVSDGSVELRDGSKIMGSIVVEDDGLTIKTRYGVWTLHFKPEDLQMITFHR